VNFPFICSNFPAAPAYGVYLSQMIRYFRACGSYQDFLDKRVAANKEATEPRVPFGTMAKRKSTKVQTTIYKTYI
jgi:hypothetical protein